ncbi:hypothetical protein AAVH_34702, partial [Aphelenchoides avenae]
MSADDKLGGTIPSPMASPPAAPEPTMSTRMAQPISAFRPVIQSAPSSSTDMHMPQDQLSSFQALSPSLLQASIPPSMLQPSSWPNLEQHLSGFRSFFTAQRSLYTIANPQLLFTQPQYKLIRRLEYDEMERGCVSLIYNMVNDHFYPLGDFTPNQRKTFLKSFAQEFGPLYRVQLSATVFPGDTKKLVTHYGYYFDSEQVEDFFADMNQPIDEQLKFAKGCMERVSDISRKFQELAVTELEWTALTAIMLFTMLERLQMHPSEARAKRDTVFAELNRHLTSKGGFEESAIRFGRLLLFLQDCI